MYYIAYFHPYDCTIYSYGIIRFIKYNTYELIKQRGNNMNTIQTTVDNYLEFCEFQKCLDKKTIKAYRIDLNQFFNGISINEVTYISSNLLENFIVELHKKYKPKTAKRKIATLKAFFHYLEYKDIIKLNPFNKVNIKFREPLILPKTIPLYLIESLLSSMYKQHSATTTSYQKSRTLRDIAVIEVLFATGMRISELCFLKASNINLHDKTILIFGKNSKERIVQIGNDDVIHILNEYQKIFQKYIEINDFFFTNKTGDPLSDQSVRRMIKKYTSLAAIDLHITPHMFRHTFATSLLEADVDIRYIQEMLGHSSINITEIYTHVNTAKQKSILTNKHPRNNFKIK